MKVIHMHKWCLYWMGLILLIITMVCLFWQVDRAESNFQKQLELAIPSLGAFCSVYLTLIIFLKSRDDMARGHRERLQQVVRNLKAKQEALWQECTNRMRLGHLTNKLIRR